MSQKIFKIKNLTSRVLKVDQMMTDECVEIVLHSQSRSISGGCCNLMFKIWEEGKGAGLKFRL